MVTTIPNIPSTIQGGSQNLLQTHGFGQQTGGLDAFLQLLMGNIAPMAMAGQNVPDTSALTALTEKIAASLGVDLSDPTALQQITDKLAALDAALNTGNTPTLLGDGQTVDDIIPQSLIRDLTAQHAATLQENTDTQAAKAPQDAAQDMAAFLNDIEPGTALPDAPDVVADSAQNDTTQQTADDLIKTQDIAGILNQFITGEQTAASSSPLMQAAANTVTTQPPVMASTVPHRAPLAMTATDEPVRSPALHSPTGQDADMTGGDFMTATDADRDTAAQIADALKMKMQRGGRGDQPAQQTLTAQAQAQNTAAQPRAAQTASLSVINEMAAQGFDGGFGFDGDGTFGQQSFTQQSLSGDALGMGATVARESTAQNFVNYMMAGRGMSGATTQMIALQIQRNATAKISTFTMQLEPADLGRLDIEMKFARDGSVKAHLTVERPETLAMLQKDSAHLERLLAQSGLDTSEGSLSFDLRQNDDGDRFDQYGKNRNGNDFNGTRSGRLDEKHIGATIAIETAGYISQSGVDIRI